MRINFPTDIFPEGARVLQAVLKKINIDSVILQLGEKELELPLSQLTKTQLKELQAGADVRINLPTGLVLAINQTRGQVSPPVLTPAAETDLSSLATALESINVPVNEGTMAAARLLLRGELPLKEKLVWAILPFVQKEQGEIAVELLKANFPPAEELVELAAEIILAPRHLISFAQKIEELSWEEKEALSEPSWENRGRLSSLQNRALIQGIGRLLAAERLAESLSNLTSVNQEYIFAIPFLLADTLSACWIQITRETNQKGEKRQAEKDNFNLTLEIPTLTFGLVEVEMRLLGRNVDLTLCFERGIVPKSLDAELKELKEELADLGWVPQRISIKDSLSKEVQ